MSTKEPWATLHATNGWAVAIYLLACLGIGLCCWGLLCTAFVISRKCHGIDAKARAERRAE